MRQTILGVLFCVCLTMRLTAQDITNLVDPFIGAAAGGNTLLSTLAPWGMASSGPTDDLSIPLPRRGASSP